MSFDTEHLEFIQYLRIERQYSPHTCKHYQRDLDKLHAYFTSLKLNAWQQVEAKHIQSYLSLEHGRGLKAQSLQRLLSSLRSFYDYMISETKLKTNPALCVHAPKRAGHLPQTLDADQMDYLLTKTPDSELEARDLCIMELMYSTGLRVGELAQLSLQDIDSQQGQVRILGKGKKVRMGLIGRPALEALQAWLKIRCHWCPSAQQSLFVTRRGQTLSIRAIEKRLHLFGQKMNLGQRLYPHLFRHSFASHLLESSGDLRAVQELLGHQDLNSTQIYTALNFSHLAKVYDQCHPRAFKQTSSK